MERSFTQFIEEENEREKHREKLKEISLKIAALLAEGDVTFNEIGTVWEMCMDHVYARVSVSSIKAKTDDD